MSETKYIKGKYYKTCAFSLCNEIAVGRKDKLFCSNQCKNAHNNAITSEVNKHTKGYDTKLKRANRILLSIYQENEKGYFAVKQITLSNENFPFDLPTVQIKDDRFSSVFYSFGSYAFCKVKDSYIFIKVKPQLI